MKTEIDFPEVIRKFDGLLARGLCSGVGSANGQMCIEAAITQALGLPFNDEPECVAESVRRYKIRLNDTSRWISAHTRAEALRGIGIAQIGSKGVVDDKEFVRRLADKTARILIPQLFREVFSKDTRCMAAADRCEEEGVAALSEARAAAAAYAAAAAAADYAAAYDAAYAAYAAYAAAYAADAAAYAADGDRYLKMSANIALEVLIELKSPGAAFVD